MVANMILMRQKFKNYLFYVITAVVIATAFFVHEAFPTASKEYLEAKANWEAAKSKTSAALDNLKKLNADLYLGKITLADFSAKQPELMEAYNQNRKEHDKLLHIVKKIKSEARFLHFNSVQYFLGELGWAVGLFLYAFTNLFYTFYFRHRYWFVKGEVTGRLLLHSTLLFVGCFYTFYVFYAQVDFHRAWYFIAMALCTVTLVIASNFITKSYINRTRYLRRSIQQLVGFIFRIRTKHYSRVAAKALYAEKQNIIINKHGDTVEDNSNEFDKDFYQTLRKIEL